MENFKICPNNDCGNDGEYNLDSEKCPSCDTTLVIFTETVDVDPVPVLKAGVIYVGDNGRLICLECAGMSAKYTGLDLSGQKVEALGTAEDTEWLKRFGKHLKCERGCTSYIPISDEQRVILTEMVEKGADFDHMRDALVFHKNGPLERGDANAIVEKFLKGVMVHA